MMTLQHLDFELIDGAECCKYWRPYTAMKTILVLAALALTGCSTFNPLTGEQSRPPGTFTINVAPTGCGVVLDSNTLKGGPSLVLTKTPDGGCQIDIRHNPSIEEIQPLLSILGAI